MSGWIKLQHSLNEHWIGEDPKILGLWVKILLSVNRLTKNVMIGDTLIQVQPGQSVMSLRSWSERLKISHSSVRRLLLKLQKSEAITIQQIRGTTTLLTVCNWDLYQNSRHTPSMDGETVVKQSCNTDETSVNTNIRKVRKERKREEKKEEKKYTDDFELAWAAYGRVGGKSGAAKAWEKLSEENQKHIIEWAAAEYVQGKDPKYTPHMSTYLNDGRYETQIETRNQPTLFDDGIEYEEL